MAAAISMVGSKPPAYIQELTRRRIVEQIPYLLHSPTVMPVHTYGKMRQGHMGEQEEFIMCAILIKRQTEVEAQHGAIGCNVVLAKQFLQTIYAEQIPERCHVLPTQAAYSPSVEVGIGSNEFMLRFLAKARRALNHVRETRFASFIRLVDIGDMRIPDTGVRYVRMRCKHMQTVNTA